MSERIVNAKNRELRAAETSTRPFDARTLKDFAASLTLSPHSIASYKKCLAYFFTYLLEKGINKPEYSHVAAYHEDLIASGRKPSTVYNYMAAVRAFFRWTQSKGLYRDVSAEISIPHAEQVSSRKTLTASQLRKLMNSIDRETLQGMRDYAILALMVTGGFSALELSQANVGDVCESNEGYILYVRGNDGQRHEAMRVPSHVMEALSAYLEARGQGGGRSSSPDAPLFMGVSNRNMGKDEHMTVGSISRIAKNALRNAGFNDTRLSAQSLKVSAMKLALQNGERLEDVQKFARHKYIRTTLLYQDTPGRVLEG